MKGISQWQEKKEPQSDSHLCCKELWCQSWCWLPSQDKECKISYLGTTTKGRNLYQLLPLIVFIGTFANNQGDVMGWSQEFQVASVLLCFSVSTTTLKSTPPYQYSTSKLLRRFQHHSLSQRTCAQAEMLSILVKMLSNAVMVSSLLT